jgi:hypothetical protein
MRRVGALAFAMLEQLVKGAAIMSTLVFQRQVPVRHEVDICVIGGGPAGVAAAVTAARQGATVFLADAQAYFGGMGTAGLVPAFMTFSDGVNFLAGGIGAELLKRLQQADGTYPANGTAIRVEVLKRVYDQMVAESGTLFYLQTNLIGVEQKSGRANAAVLWGKSGLFAVKAAVFIDCTGDGDLAAWAGAPYEKGDEAANMMAATLCSLWAGIDWEAVHKSGLGAGNARIEEAIRDGVISQDDRHLPGIWRTGDTLGGGNIGHCFGVDGTDERSLTAALVLGRKLILEYERYYKEYLKGFERMELIATGSALGVRETRRIMGDYCLCLDDFQRRAVFEDEIGRYSYPVDIHAATPGSKAYEQFHRDFTTLRYGKGESYGIPYRALVPRDLVNVLVAGRCISTDRYMQSSIRVMPGCYITGQAAGMAAYLALACAGEVRDISVPELQTKLKSIGAYLPHHSATP